MRQSEMKIKVGSILPLKGQPTFMESCHCVTFSQNDDGLSTLYFHHACFLPLFPLNIFLFKLPSLFSFLIKIFGAETPPLKPSLISAI